MKNTSVSTVEGVRKSAKILKSVFGELKKAIRPGITTLELDQMAENIITGHGAKCAFKGYKGFPSTLCTSVNEVVVHGIPSKEVLKEGDIVGVDCGAYYGGFYSDAAFTAPVGNVSERARKLLEITEKALYAGIMEVRPGARIHDISSAVQKMAEDNGYGIVRMFVGHGIGRQLHELPEIPNFGKRGTGSVIAEGMVLAIEPMLTTGSYDVEILEDGWTAVTKDRDLAAHFEHSVAVTSGGAEILT